MITNRQCAMVHHIIVDSGTAEIFDKHLRGPGGPKPKFPRSLYLIGWLLAVLTYQKSHIRLIHRILTKEVPMEWQEKWGVRWKVESGDGSSEWRIVTEESLQEISKRVRALYNYTTNFIPDEPKKGIFRGDIRSANEAALNILVDSLIRGTLPMRPAGSADYAMDSTGLWATERSRRALPAPEDLMSGVADGDDIDDDADHPAGNDGDPDSTATERRRRVRGRSDATFGVKTSKSGKEESYFGYQLHAAIRVAKGRVAGQPDEPQLIEALRVTTAKADIVDPSLDVIDTILRTGQNLRYLIVDKHYHYKGFGRWLLELVKRGVKQIHDLRVDEIGFKDWNGALMTAGVPHCPATPLRLGPIAPLGLPPDRDASRKEWQDYLARKAAFEAAIAEREAYAATRHSPLNEDGCSRWICPAKSGKIGCPLVTGSVQVAQEAGLPIAANPPDPDDAPAMCRQQVFSLKVVDAKQERIMKLYQDLYWGSTKHREIYNKRTYVEGFFGTLKGDTSAGKDREGSLYTGLAHETLDATMFAIAANVILYRSWHAKTGLGDETSPILYEESEDTVPVHVTLDEYHDLMARREETDQAA